MNKIDRGIFANLFQGSCARVFVGKSPEYAFETESQDPSRCVGRLLHLPQLLRDGWSALSALPVGFRNATGVRTPRGLGVS